MEAKLLDNNKGGPSMWEIVAPEFAAAQAEAMALFRRYEVTARALSRIDEIVRDAHAGRVETLFVAAGDQRWGVYDPVNDTVAANAEAEPTDEDLLDSAAIQSLLSDGTGYVPPSAQMPNDLPAAAEFRY
jgi:hypothetical protein